MTKKDLLLYDALHGDEGGGPLGDLSHRIANYWARYGDTAEAVDCTYMVPGHGRVRIVLAVMPATPPFDALAGDCVELLERIGARAVTRGDVLVTP